MGSGTLGYEAETAGEVAPRPERAPRGHPVTTGLSCSPSVVSSWQGPGFGRGPAMSGLVLEMADPTFAPAKRWTRERRFAEAVKKVVEDDWSQARAAEYYGVSRPRLNEKVKRHREGEDLAEKVGAAAVSPLGLQERKRVPKTIGEFDDYYFGHWICPDCGVHHPRPGFHDEIWDACYSGDKRVLINMPPYHSKSTNITVKGTVFDIAQDPNTRVLIVSKSLSFARTFLVSISDLLTNHDLYLPGRDLIDDVGGFKPTSDAIWNQNSIYVAGRTTAEKDPTVQVLGLSGQIYGRRALKIVFDDCATLENMRNPDRVREHLEWIDKEALSRIGRNGVAIFVGTRVNHGDIYLPLGNRAGYRVLRYSCILDEAGELTLWPDHFPFDAAASKRAEMTDADWQLVYQNVDVPGLSASFTTDAIDACKDEGRIAGHYLPEWRLIAGLDLAGGNRDSGYTAGALIGIDLRTGNRFLVDLFNAKSMRAPQLRDQIFEWCERYPIYEWRVENNGLQSQLVQYNEEIIRELAKRGIRVTPHNTHTNKWDAEFGVESMAPLFNTGMVSIPWGNVPTRQKYQQLIDQLVVFPMGAVTDVVMSHWFADLGCRDIVRRAHLPMFSDRMKVPERIKRRRVVVDFATDSVQRVPLYEQAPRLASSPSLRQFRRRVVGHPGDGRDFEPATPPEPKEYVNVAGTVPQD